MLKMDDLIPISFLNDFIFCPASIYFHQLYGAQEKLTYQRSVQINGTAAHRTVDSSTYTSRKNVLQLGRQIVTNNFYFGRSKITWGMVFVKW